MVFFDNDILLKLYHLGLWNETLTVLECSAEDVRVLPTARHQIPSNRENKQRYDQAFLAEVTKHCSRLTVLSGETSAETKDLLNGFPRFLDSGEVLLFSHAVQSPSARVLTGDRRALLGLAKEPALKEIVHSLRGRVCCLESTILLLFDAGHFELVKRRVVERDPHDQALKAAFGSKHLAEESNVRRTLEGYLGEVEELTGRDWFYRRRP